MPLEFSSFAVRKNCRLININPQSEGPPDSIDQALVLLLYAPLLTPLSPIIRPIKKSSPGSILYFAFTMLVSTMCVSQAMLSALRSRAAPRVARATSRSYGNAAAGNPHPGDGLGGAEVR